MLAVRQIVDRKSITSIDVPEEFGERVKIIILPLFHDPDAAMDSSALHALQSSDWICPAGVGWRQRGMCGMTSEYTGTIFKYFSVHGFERQ